ncbi:hypothetical protein [Clostridium brassicae]|uniref:Uncharacterized protein n=1 Tax=Clostridium brassicae TaxID=2999072 RepID=A0ABT4DAK6_9CLOT|nr:hypothetical protein [Clostridium brassicae]MCY6959350.1 hypothetical protein [Clostridium brassicae]
MSHYIEDASRDEIAANIKAVYDDKYIIKSLFCGKTRDDLAKEFNHKNYRTLDMFMRRRGYLWNPHKQNYVSKPENDFKDDISSSPFKVEKIISLFEAGYEPMEVAKKVGMKDHRAMALYMKNKGYVWSSEKQNYSLLKGECSKPEFVENEIEFEDKMEPEIFNSYMPSQNHKLDTLSTAEKLERLTPMFEMIERNKDKIAEILSINNGGTIPRYVVGGITITKSLCMSHNLAELIKEFSNEKNISQREIFEVAIIEFLKKYGYENEVNALFSS